MCGGRGVECLQGGGEIAAATSRAYKSTVTLAYVTGRSVDVGAYCSRLCQRVIQHNDAPLILTGASALNKVLGREVYTSNAQIGGPKVMANNGVSHMVVPDDVRGVSNILRWLSFVPAKKGAPLLPFTLPKATGSTPSIGPLGSPRECAARSEGDASALLRPWVVHGGDDGLGQERGHGQGTPRRASHRRHRGRDAHEREDCPRGSGF